MIDELKPCPFCGSDHIVESVGTKAGGEPWPYIECFGCSASAEPDVWNRRADSDDIATLRATITRLEGERDELRNALKMLHDDTAEYQKINRIGGYNNHAMKAARAALQEPKA